MAGAIMLDGYHKATTDRFWNFLAGGLARLGLKPNQVTLIGLALVLGSCLLYVVYQDTLWFGILLGFSFAFDGLDGAVARITDTASKYGGYLDAIIDRYQEGAVFLALAWVEGYWLPCFIAMAGSLLISYNKARTAVEVPVDNDRWPDLLERLERIVILCGLLILDPLASNFLALDGVVLFYGLWVFAVVTHITAVQRFFRARRLLIAVDGNDGQ
jgi:archaetidylinositol phosphate synthase